MSWHTIKLTPGTLRLGPTLFSGQVFRWRQIDPTLYRGVIGEHVVDLKEELAEMQTHSKSKEESPKEQEKKQCKTVGKSSPKSKLKEKEEMKENEEEEEKKQDILLFKGTTKGGLQSDKEELHSLLRSYFQLSVDYSILREAWRKTPVFSQAQSGNIGLRVIKQQPFECFIAFLCSQNNNVSRISQLVQKIATNYGQLITAIEGIDYYSFPDIKALSKATEKELRDLKFGYRASYIVESCKQLDTKGGEKWLQELAEQGQKGEEEEVRKVLREFKGVGRKVADCIVLFSLNCRNIVPIDTHMLKWAVKLFKVKKDVALTDTTYYEISKKFSELLGDGAGWAHSILFSSTLNASSEQKPKKRTTASLSHEEEPKRRGKKK